MKILESWREIAKAQESFASDVRSHSSKAVDVTIGFQSGNTDREVLWLPDMGFWAHLGDPPRGKSQGNRYWNVFGLGEPYGMVPITCEINPPREGINRQVAGAFATDAEGKIHVLHRGILNAGGRVPKAEVRRSFRWHWALVDDGDRTSKVMPIAEIGSGDFIFVLRDFIREVARFKDSTRRGRS